MGALGYGALKLPPFCARNSDTLESPHVTGRDAIGACKTMGLAESETIPLAPFFPRAAAALAALALLCAFQSLGRFLDHLRNRNVPLVRLGVNKIKRVLAKPDVKLMIAACGLSMAAAGRKSETDASGAESGAAG